jgi:alanine racemase
MIATLPVVHTDGYLRGAAKYALVLIGNETYRVIGAVRASHSIMDLGAVRKVKPGDLAILVRPDHFALNPVPC